MAVTINGTTGIDKVQDGSITAADLDTTYLTATGDGSGLTNLPGGGKVLQVVSTTKTDRSSTTSTSYVDVPGLSATITPLATTSKVYVMLTVAGGSAESSSWIGIKLNLKRGSTSIGMGDSGWTTQSFGVGSGMGTRAYYQTLFYGGNYLDSPATASSITYQVQFSTVNYGSASPAYINRSTGGGSSAYEASASSTITLMEIGV
jgi:hypothetical protein